MIGRGRFVVALMVALAALAVLLGYLLRQWVSEVPRRLGGILTRLEQSGDFAAYGQELQAVLAERPEFRAFTDILPWPGQPDAASLPALADSRRAQERFQDHKMSLLKLCRQGRYSTGQCDLLLALLLLRDGRLLPCARLLELLRAEGRSSKAVEALLLRVYQQLGRGADGPRESPKREPCAVW